MSDVVIKVEDLSKQYRLGQVGTGTISHDLNRWWHKVRGKEDPYQKIGVSNDRTQEGGEYVWALKDINFEVKQGEVLGIIGKNGAGKSTLLKILSKVTSPTTGSIKAKGRIASLLEVGTGFHPEMTGRENIYMNGTIMGMNRHEITARLDEIVEFAGVAKYLDTPVKRYSSGMTVRLGFAIAAHLEPEILIVDEVLAVGDAEFQKKAIGKMQDVSKGQGRTVLFVSHNMASVENICDRAMLLERGQVRHDGRVADIISKYKEINNDVLNTTLSTRKQRTGNGLFKFNDVIFNRNEGISVGDSFIIEIIYESNLEVSDIDIAITFCRGFDDRVLVIDNKYQGEKVILKKTKGSLLISVPKMMLIPNTYTVNLWAGKESEVYDYLVGALSIVVEGADVFKSGKMLNSRQHGIVCPDKCIWE